MTTPDPRVCSVDGGDHDWTNRSRTFLCARPASKSVTIETGSCTKCGILRAVTRNGKGDVDIDDRRQDGVTVLPSTVQ